MTDIGTPEKQIEVTPKVEPVPGPLTLPDPVKEPDVAPLAPPEKVPA